MSDLVVILPDFSQYVIKAGDHPAGMGGKQVVLRFPNGFGASIVQSPFSYGADEGKFEMAVLLFTGEGDNYDLTYDTDITDDVLGHLEPRECVKWLHEIMALPPGRPEPREDRHFSTDVGELLDSVDSLIDGGVW